MLAIGRRLGFAGRQELAPPPVTAKGACAHARGAEAHAKVVGPRYRRKRFIPPLLLLGLIGLVQGCTSGGEDPVTQPATTTVASEPASQGSATEAPSSEPAPEKTTADSEAPAVKPIRYSGRGDKVLRIKKPRDGRQLISFTHSGQSDFIVEQLDAEHRAEENLVQSIGSYEGTAILDLWGTETKWIGIQAEGRWSVEIADMASATPLGSSAEGRGDEVLVYRGKGGVIQATHKGERLFLVMYLNEGNILGLMAGVGRHAGETNLGAGPGFVQITADGRWTIKIDE